MPERRVPGECPPEGGGAPALSLLGRGREQKDKEGWNESQLGVMGNPPPYLSHFPRCPSMVSLRPWIFKGRWIGMWVKAHP